MKFKIGQQVSVVSREDDVFHDFVGTIKDIVMSLYTVEDMDGDCWSVEESQMELIGN